MGSIEKKPFTPKQTRLTIEHFMAGTTARCATSLIGANFKTSAYYMSTGCGKLSLITLSKRLRRFLVARPKLIKATVAASASVSVVDGLPEKLGYLTF
jgi:hypothetical protein